MDYIIKKLWWENVAELAKSAKNIYKDYIEGKLQAVIVSAIRSPHFNTTDKLIELWLELQKGKIDVKLIAKKINELENFHLNILEEKILCSKSKIVTVIQESFISLRKNVDLFIQNKSKQIIPTIQNDYTIENSSWELFSVLWFGEAVSCRVFSSVVDSTSTDWVISKSVDLSNIIAKWSLVWKDEKEIFQILSIKLSSIIEKQVNWGNIPVLSGYIGTFKQGIQSAVWRGYSDATAAICTVWLAQKWHNVIFEIQKSVKGLLSCDPRFLKNPDDAQLIPELDYLTAREITGDCGAQAKLLHHQTLRSEVQEAWVKIHLFDPFNSSDGSWIIHKNRKENKSEKCSWVSFIGGRENVIFFSISSWKMFENGILSRLFDVVKNYYWVDIVSASETEVSFTIDWCWVENKKLEAMVEEIRNEFGMWENNEIEFIEYRKNKSLIFCVGQHMKNYVWLLSRATRILGENNINIEIASQGRLQRAMIFGIDECDMKKAVNVLHTEFITALT